MGENMQDTMMFKKMEKEDLKPAKQILTEVYNALKEKGYNPISQIVGYLLSGDPAYITSFKGARNLIRKIERDELLEELIKSYLEKQ